MNTLLLVLLTLSVGNGSMAADTAVAGRPQTYFLFVFSNPVDGMESEFNRWYEQQHAPDVVSIPGFVSAQRFVIADQQLRAGSPGKPRYLVVYQIVTDNLTAVSTEVNRRLASGQTRMSPSFDAKSAQGLLYRALGPEVPGVGGTPPGAVSGTDQTYYQLVFADPVAGREAEFNRWYDEHHAPEVAAVPGFVSWQRAVLNDQQMNPPAPASKYVTLFKIVTADLPAVFKEFGARAPRMGISPAFDGNRTFGYTYRAIGPLLLGDEIRAQRATGTH